MRLAKIQAISVLAGQAGPFTAQIESFVSQAMLLAADGLTLAEFGQLFAALVALAVQAVESLGQLTGEQKKEQVLDAVSYLYDFIAPSIPLPWYLQIFRSRLKEPVRSIVLAVASGVIEVFVARLPEPPATTVAHGLRAA